MSKERARRRAQRESARAVAQARRERALARKARRRALLRRLIPPQRRRAWLLARRSPGQRALVIGIALGLLWTIWYLVPGWPMRVGLSLVLILLLPVLVIVTFDRRV